MFTEATGRDALAVAEPPSHRDARPRGGVTTDPLGPLADTIHEGLAGPPSRRGPS